MKEKITEKKQKRKYESIEIDVHVVDGADVITASSPLPDNEHDNAYGDFDFFE